MKIRVGYVSNSSSSSFIALVKRVNNPDKAIKDGKKVMVYLPGCGTSGDAEDWSMILDPETWGILNQELCFWFDKRKKDARYFEVLATAEEGALVVPEDTEASVISFQRDYSSPNDKEHLMKFLKESCY